MNVEVKKLENNEIQLDIQIDAAKASKEYDKACNKLSKRVNIPGFRAGKAPKNILEKRIGVETIQREVLESTLPEVFAKTIQENKFDIISEPYIESYEFNDDKSFKAVAKLELKPEVELCEYKGIDIEIEEYKNEENALDKEIEVLAEKYAELKDVEGRKTTDKDTVNIDFEGFVDGEAIKGGAAKSYPLNIEKSNFIPGFAEQLVGKDVGEEFEIEVKFPENYHDDKIKGKDAKFNIKINSIQEKVLPEINDEFAAKVGPFKSLDELKADIEKYLENMVKTENEKKVAEKIFEKLNNEIDVNIQESMLKREGRALMGEFQQRITSQGGDWDKMLEEEGHEKIWEQLKTEAENRIKNSLIITKIAETEKIEVEGKDLEVQIEEMARIYNTDKTAILGEIQKNSQLIHSLSQQVLSQKVTQFLLNNVNIKYTKSK